jgi:hypothetical protein
MSLFKVVKYSSLLFFLGKYKSKLFRVLSVLLFAAVTSLLYQDVAAYLQLQYPGTVIYALAVKVAIVYGALAFVLWQFRPSPDPKPANGEPEQAANAPDISADAISNSQNSALNALGDVSRKGTLRSRYDSVLENSEEQKD